MKFDNWKQAAGWLIESGEKNKMSTYDQTGVDAARFYLKLHWLLWCPVFWFPPQKTLHLLQNWVTLVLMRTRRVTQITRILNSLPWPPVSFRIDVKVLWMVFKSLNGPLYLADLLLPNEPSRSLRSSGTGLLITPTVNTGAQSEAAFQHFIPRLRSSLPENLRAAQNDDIFKSRLKTPFLSHILTFDILFYFYFCILLIFR